MAEKNNKFNIQASKWRNPFPKEEWEDCLPKYVQYIRAEQSLIADLPQLRGMQLGCFCKPDDCHGDILIKLLHEVQGTETHSPLPIVVPARSVASAQSVAPVVKPHESAPASQIEKSNYTAKSNNVAFGSDRISSAINSEKEATRPFQKKDHRQKLFDQPKKNISILIDSNRKNIDFKALFLMQMST